MVNNAAPYTCYQYFFKKSEDNVASLDQNILYMSVPECIDREIKFVPHSYCEINKPDKEDDQPKEYQIKL